MNPLALSLIAVPFIHMLAVAIPIAIMDFRYHRIPNKLNLPVGATALVFGIVATIVSGEPLRIVASFGVATLVFFVGMLLRSNLGMGDIKMLTIMAFMLSWLNPFAILGVIVLAVVILCVMVWTPFTRKIIMWGGQSVAFGPFLLLAFTIVSALCFIGVA